ncbi:MAG: hypothetical protein VX428_06960 [Verrucomicrobiota bacterium]|nr:hypothetical protein [Verrucomicrobiota bacterium]
MKPHLLSAIIIILTIIRFLFHTEIYNSLWLFERLIDGLIISLSVFCCFKLTKIIFRNRDLIMVVSLVGLLLVGVISYGTNFTTDLGDKLRFLRYEKKYVQIIEKIETKKISFNGSVNGISYNTEADPVMRVSFSWGGILDNWRGIIYDPTNELSTIAENNQININSGDRNSLTPADEEYIKETTELKLLFGGVIYKVKKMANNWYLCWFT